MFQADATWAFGIAPAGLRDFMSWVRADSTTALERFAALLALASPRSRHFARQLLEQIDHAPTSVLVEGLRLLMETDLRLKAADIDAPTLVLLGDRDPLLPLGMARALGEIFPCARVEVIPGAGHIPFLRHSAQVLSQVERFLDAHGSNG